MFSSLHLDLYPMVRVAIILAVGIVFSGCMPSISVSCWIGCMIVSFVIALISYKKNSIQSVSIILCLFSAGGLLATNARPSKSLPVGKIQYDAVVLTQPIQHGRTVWMQLLPTTGALKGETVSASLLCDTVQRRYLQLHVGSGISITSEMKSLEVSKFRSHDIRCQTFVYYANWQSKAVNLRVLTAWQRTRIAALRFRGKLVDKYKQMGMEGQVFAVVTAMTLGDKSSLSHETKENYQLSGASHVLALSGLHLSIIYVLLTLFTFGQKKRLWSELILLIAIWIYTVMVGMSPSVVRSATMLTIYSAVGLAGRTRMSLNVLAFVAVVMLSANPLSLYDISFQLSFMAVAFIMMFQSPVSGLIPEKVQQRHPLLKWVWQLTVLSCVAQLGTTPLVAYYFGRLPLYFMITNLVVIPGATLILYLSVGVVALAWWLVVQRLVVSLLMLVTSTLNTVLEYISHWPLASISVQMNGIQVTLTYVIIIASSLLIRMLVSSNFGIQKATHRPVS